jgi:transposase
MKKERRKFSAAFKAQVAIEALKERESLAELSKRFDIHPNMISKWKQEFIEQSTEIFSSKAPEENFEAEKERLFAKIGQLEMERDWLKKISKRAGL